MTNIKLEAMRKEINNILAKIEDKEISFGDAANQLLDLYNVSNRRELLIDFAEKVYRRVFFTWDKKTSEKVVDEYIKGNL